VAIDIPFGCGTGLVKRDYKKNPSGYLGALAPRADDKLLIDEAEWPDRLNELNKSGTSLLHWRIAFIAFLKSLNQNPFGLCWAFSSTKALMYIRILMGLEPAILSAWYVAGMIKRWRDQGGWGAESLEFIADTGVPLEEYCPSYSSKYDTADTRANAALNKCTEWRDGTEDPSYNTKLCVSSLLQTTPCIVDLNDMGHSMCAIHIGSLNPLEIIYDNSWGQQGEDGLYRGRGARARPDGLVIPAVALPNRR